MQIIDIAEEHGLAKSTVSASIKNLKKENLICSNGDGRIRQTTKGKKHAEQIRRKYDILVSFFVRIGASEKRAKEDICRLKHYISEQMCNLIAIYISAQNEYKEKVMNNTNVFGDDIAFKQRSSKSLVCRYCKSSESQ